MPELPEVETVLRGLRENCLGRTISAVRIFKPLVVKTAPPVFISSLTSQAIQDINRHGKALFVRLQNEVILRIHLGMTGQLLFTDESFAPDAYVRVIFSFSDGKNLVYRDVRQFGKLSLAKIEKEAGWGPDAWKADNKDIVTALRAKRGMIKHALLNQAVIAGLGNIYVDESLFEARIHPQRKIETLSKNQLIELSSIIKRILNKSIGVGGTSFRDYVDTTGRRGGFRGWLHVYGKAGKQCSRCGSLLTKTQVAGRGTHFCPRCQVRPRNIRHDTKNSRSLASKVKT